MVDREDVIKAINSNIELESNYAHNQTTPIYQSFTKLECIKDDIRNFTAITRDRSHVEVRNRFLQKVIPLLPTVKECNIESHFATRNLTTHDFHIYGGLQEGATISITNCSLSFYNNGRYGAGIPGDYTKSWLVIENTEEMKVLDKLSFVPSEKELLVTEGMELKIISKYSCIQDFISLNNLNQVAENYFKRIYDNQLRDGANYYSEIIFASIN